MKMFKSIREFCHGLVLSVGFLPAVWSANVHANLSGADMGTYTATPILTVESVPPLVMIAMSMDHQYFIKAYNDYTDLDKDGTVERTYSDQFEYYGYFHSDFCYSYDTGENRFEPSGLVDTPREGNSDTTYDHYCTEDDTTWSGNFLNWALMTRMDIVRKILYGGLRSTDEEDETVLERAYLPGDAHSFAKYYNGADLAELTPHDGIRTDTTNGGDSDGFDDSNEGITICSITQSSAGNSSQNVNVPPMMRVASGNRSLWATNERRQCSWSDEFGSNGNSNDPAISGIGASASDPPVTAILAASSTQRHFDARVVVCDPDHVAPQNLENCRAYGDNLKPEGLLQKYGLDGQMQFALVTGSYADNLSGGRLRKRMSTMNDEIDTSDGTFIALSSSTPGIIKALNAVRIFGYGYDDGTYLSGGDGGSENCNFQLTDIATEGKCASWGNPMSEIYLEALRYFASSTRSPTAAFNNGGVDTAYIPGLLEDSDWTRPITEDNSCASLNTIIFNASVSSYDNNATDPDFTSTTAAALTKTIGNSAGEALEGNNFFAGRSGAATNEFCTSKTIDGTNGLGDVFGLCPEAPTVLGSYHMAGLAHYAHTEDLLTGLPERQSVKTFAVSLATATPVIEVPVDDDRTVRILPAYRLRKGGNNVNEASNNPANDGGGALVDFKIVRPHTEVSATNNAVAEAGTGVFSGLFYVNWEDSEQGGDYDQDMWGMIEYRLDTNLTANQLRITTTAVRESTGIAQLFGFITSGTTQDGFHAYSGIEGANYTDPTGVPGCVNCRPISGDGGSTGQFGARSHDFTVSTTAAADLLESPLYYAAKWGGFDDANDDKKPFVRGADPDDPIDNSEWDADGDNVPDTFFFVTDPGDLESSLREIFDTILERVSSGTAAAVVANEQQGNGALFQALYDPEKNDSEGNTARWIGTLHALFVDTFGFIREDGNANGAIDDFETDPIIKLEFDESVEPSERRTKVVRFFPLDDDPDTDELEGPDPDRPDPSDPAQFTQAAAADLFGEDGLKTVWNAREQLSELDETSIVEQRAYDSPADEGRHILTWIDDGDKVVSTGEVIDFTSDNIDSGNFFWLDSDTEDDAEDLVDWVRGREDGLDGLRTRSVDYDGSEGPRDVEIMRLGDIIHSTPVSVGAPFAAFDQSALDASYAEFREQYQERRQVVYVGANDGMIHAFNAGFFDANDLAFKLSPSEDSGVTEHPLGSELWAYVPNNLLPHLQWTARPDYSHVYYMDLPIRVFDVKIFDDDDTHPNGWGTILVAGMRFGGGTDNTGINVDVDADGDGDNDIQTKSAYVVLDITDPEQPPTVIAELSPPNAQFTTSVPQVVGFGTREGETGPNKWYLVFGTGPTNLNNATYESYGDPLQNANVFVYDLELLLTATDQNAALLRTFELDEANTFVGDIAGADFDIDMKDEALYFGTVGKPVAPDEDPEDVEQGSLYRIMLSENPTTSAWSEPTRILDDLNRPFVTQPAVTIDRKFRRWVVAASGRLFVNDDKLTENQQTAYGIIDPEFSGEDVPAAVADLVDVSTAQVFGNDTVEGVSLPTSADADGNDALSTKELREAVAAAGGWRKDFAINGVLPVDATEEEEEEADLTEDDDAPVKPAERSASRISLFGGIMFASLFTPSTDLCGADGNSRLLGIDFSTGVPPSFSVFPCADCDDPTVPVPESFDQGGGYSSSASTHFGNQTIEGKVTIITQDSRGEPESTEAQTGAGDPAAEISWREFRNLETGLEGEAGSDADEGAGGGGEGSGSGGEGSGSPAPGGG